MNLFGEHSDYHFPIAYDEIVQRVDLIKPARYGSTRNFINGDVTYLSPYISRGVISTKFVLDTVLKKGFKPIQIEKFIQELAWRDYWQQIWIAKGEAINEDIKHKQMPVDNHAMSRAILKANTGILAIDRAIEEFYESGYLHNHVRMYIASIACNMGHSHWKTPAKWMYYYLLDADWASNALSWQWVAGANANKKYVANQENINKYCFTDQKNSFLDVPYAAFSSMEIPEILLDTATLELKTTLPKSSENFDYNDQHPTLIYNVYNLDPIWKNEVDANRILLLEPSHFKAYPVSKKTIDFIVDMATRNIKNIQIYTGEYKQLVNDFSITDVYYKEHPLNRHYAGSEEPRDWMFDVKGYYSSFFAYWKKCKKQLTF